jgi:hypothetical protein
MANNKKKNILVLAKNNAVEALRMASGLTLLDDTVRVDVFGKLTDAPEIVEQRDALEFADVPLRELNLDTGDTLNQIARDILEADVVFVV